MKRVGKYILVIPEGWCEYNYAQALRASLAKDKQRSIRLEMPKPNSENSPVQLLEKALVLLKKSKREKNPYDDIWIFLDNDGHPNLSEFFQKWRKTTIKISYSSLCIEHWFMIHMDDNRRSYQNANQVYQALNSLWQKRFNQPYDKRRMKHFDILRDFLPLAIERANSIRQQAEFDKIPLEKSNPAFTVQDFISYFQNL